MKKESFSQGKFVHENDNLDKCWEEVKDLREYSKRVTADLDNLRRERDGDIDRAVNDAKQEIVKNLLYVMDDMDLLIKNFQDKESVEYKAIKLIYKNFKNVLVSEGLEEIDASGNYDFLKHEAVCLIESEEVPDFKIVDVVLPGYMFHSKVIRPSKVKVALHVNRNKAAIGQHEVLDDNEG